MRVPAQRGHHPSVILGDGQWDLVVKALRARGTQREARLADRIDETIQKTRCRFVDRLEIRP